MLLTTKYIKTNYSISRMALLKWETDGLLHPLRTPGGERRYKKEELDSILGGNLVHSDCETILYARVSTKKQEKYLTNQIERLKQFAHDHSYKYSVISEIASGINENRSGIAKLLRKIMKGQVKRVVVEYPDRLARFGLKYLEMFIKSYGAEIVVINEPDHEPGSSEELAEDLVSIVSSFAARIYGKRSRK